MTRQECVVSAMNGLLVGAQVGNPNAFLIGSKLEKMYAIAEEIGAELYRRTTVPEGPDGPSALTVNGTPLAIPAGFRLKTTGVIHKADLVAVPAPLSWINPPAWMAGRQADLFLAVAEHIRPSSGASER